MTLHEELKKLFSEYARVEALLIEKLQEAERVRLFERFGYSSLSKYAIGEFGISEGQAYLLVSLSKKCSEVPELQKAVSSGELSASKAKRILSVVEKNPKAWIEKARTLPQRQIEWEVAKENPVAVIQERIKPVCAEAAEFRCKINPKLEKALTRVREVCSQKLNRQATWEEALSCASEVYLQRHDPVVRAQRILAKKPMKSTKVLSSRIVKSQSVPGVPVSKEMKPANFKRVPIPREIEHQVFLRDFGQCQDRNPNGKQCPARQWTRIHHIKEVAHGGTNELSNLTTLCDFHHRKLHGFESRRFAKTKVSEGFAAYKLFALN